MAYANFAHFSRRRYKELKLFSSCNAEITIDVIICVVSKDKFSSRNIQVFSLFMSNLQDKRDI